MIDVNIMKQYLGTGLKCHLMGEYEDDYADPTVPKVFEFMGIRTTGSPGVMYECEFMESGDWWDIEDVFPILHPLSSIAKEIEVNGERFVPYKRLLESNNFNLEVMSEEDLQSYAEHYEGECASILMLHEAQQLYSWGFDLDGLIDSKEAVDVNSLKGNKG